MLGQEGSGLLCIRVDTESGESDMSTFSGQGEKDEDSLDKIDAWEWLRGKRGEEYGVLY